MSELAFDKEGQPFRFSRRTKKLRPRRWKNAGQRGTCAAVLDPDGEPLFIDADSEYVEFRAAVGNVPGFYRLDQCDEDGTPIEDAPPAYVSIESTRNVAPIGESDPRDAIIRDLAQINADVTRTIAERFGNVMQAAADILRAADAAGLPRREPPPPPPAPATNDGDDDEGDDDDESEPAPPESPFGSFQPFVEMAMPHLPKFGAFLWVKFQEFMKQNATPPPAATSPATSVPAAAPAFAAAPSAATASGDVAVGPSAPEPVAPAAPVPAPASPAPAPVAASVSVPASVSTGPTSPVPPAAPLPSASAPAARAFATPTSSMPAAVATSEGPTVDSAAPNATAITGGDTAQTGGQRNAPPTIEPTPEQWEHLLAIRAQLSPREAAIAETVITRMAPEVRAQWLAELSAISVDQAVDFVRSMIPKAPPKPPAARNAKGNGQDGEG